MLSPFAQTREALLAILKDLDEDDYFAIVLFDHNIKFWKESLVKASKEEVSQALKFTRGIRDRGGKH